MKILYAIQTTGNGHLARAQSIIHKLKENKVDINRKVLAGAEVEVNKLLGSLKKSSHAPLENMI